MVEAIAAKIEFITHAKSCLKIVTNLSSERMVKATACWRKEDLGLQVIELYLYIPYICVDNNLGSLEHIVACNYWEDAAIEWDEGDG